jgi:hypothetical protein
MHFNKNTFKQLIIIKKMKKTILLFSGIVLLASSLFAYEPTLSLTNKSDLAKSPYSLTDFKKLKKANAEDPANVVKIKLLPLLFTMFTLQYERSIKENMSVACDFSFLRRSITETNLNNESFTTTYSAFGFSPEFRLYPNGDAREGFFVGPYATYLNFGIKGEYVNTNNAKGTGEISNITAIGGGVLLGWKWLIQDAFVIEAHLGYNYLSLTTPSSVNVTYTDGTKGVERVPELSVSGGIPTGGFTLGYAF